MYDAVMVGGKFVGNEKLMDRLLEAEPIVTTAVKFCTHLTLRMKEFFSLKDIQELVMVRVFVKREATFGRARPLAASTSRGSFVSQIATAGTHPFTGLRTRRTGVHAYERTNQVGDA